MPTVTEKPTTKPRISSGCKTFTLPKPPAASQTTQKTWTVLKATPTPTKLCLRKRRLPALLPDRQIYQEWGRHTWCNSEHRYIENIYRKWGSLITLSTHDGISIANTSAVVFWEFCSCCSILFMYGKINGNILAWEGDNGISIAYGKTLNITFQNGRSHLHFLGNTEFKQPK